jgi:ketosteroid isomerase-like protein
MVMSMAGFQLYAQKDADKLKTEIKLINDKLVKASLDNNIDAAMNFYCDDVISMPNYGPQIVGKKHLLDKNKKDMHEGFKMLSMKLQTDNVLTDKAYVIETGHYDISMQMPKMEQPLNDKGKYITVWQRQSDGSLKILVETWNTDTNPMEAGKSTAEKDME